MALAVLEINDVSLTIRSGSGKLYSEPGFARLSAKGLEFGEAARSTAWREPQSSYNQYWYQLGEAPLLVKSKWARHFADIAFAQLKQLVAEVGGVDECILAIPGSFSKQQLALLLGMLNALSIKTTAVVDNALAVRLHSAVPAIYLDLQQHQTVVSALARNGEVLEVAQQEVIPGLGVGRLHNLLAQVISRKLIETTRFDPLHDPATEQWIFDQLPGWLEQIQWQQELALSMPTPMGEQPFRLRRADVAALMTERFSVLDSFLDRWGESILVMSDSGAALAGLALAGRQVEIVAANTCVDNCLTYLGLKIPRLGELQRLKSIRIDSETASIAEDQSLLTLFLLHDHKALSLSEPVSIVVGQRGLALSRGIDKDAALVLVQQGAGLRVLQKASDVNIALPDVVKSGEVISVAGIVLPLIEVCDG